MASHADLLRLRLAHGPRSGTQMAKEIGLSQPTVSRALAAMGDEIIQTGQRKSTQYFLRDHSRGFAYVAIFRVDPAGKIESLGVLTPVRPDGFVLTQADGQHSHYEAMPWWMLDMRPQGFLGRAYAARYGAELGLPIAIKEWTDSHAVRALLVHGHDVVGNLLVGHLARDKFIAMSEPTVIRESDKVDAYTRMALAAAAGDTPGSSAGGEQPKFTAYAECGGQGRHVIVKFSEPRISPNSRRWSDLLWAEHVALSILGDASIPAAQTTIYDSPTQRFLQVQRFDRVGALGRKGAISLGALDAEFVGKGPAPWPVITQSLARQGVITPDAAQVAEVLWAFGALIGNSDMHNGNLSFVSEDSRPYDIAPAYDMTPMSFAPTSSGRLPVEIHPITLHPGVSHAAWRQAQQLALNYLSALKASTQFSPDFAACIHAMSDHIDRTRAQINRLA